MDALQGRVDSIGSEVRQIGDALRGYLDHGATATRKVKPPGTKAGRDLLQHLLGRLDQVSTELVDVQKLSSNVSPPLPNNSPDTPLSYGSPVPLPPSTHPQDDPGGPQDGIHPHPPSHEPSHPDAHPDSNAQSHSHPHPHPESGSGPGSGSGSEHQAHAPAQPRSKTTSPPADHRIPAPLSRSLPPPATIPMSISSQVRPQLSEHSSPVFPCQYQDIHVLNEDLFEEFSRHPVVRSRGYFKLQVQGLPPLRVEKMARPSRDHATSFCYKTDSQGLIKVDTGKRVRFSSPRLPFPRTVRSHWSVQAQRDLWNSTALDPPKGTRPYIIGNPLFDDVELSPGEKLRQRGRTALEGINTQYVYFNLTGKTITTMHREDAHVRSENLLRSGENKFWCFVKPSFTDRLEHHMRLEYPEMRGCSQAVRHLSRHIPPAKLDEWGVEYTLDYCVPGQAVVTEPGTYHQVLNLGPNYAVAINLEYLSSPDEPSDYTFCDDNCPDKFAISAEDFAIFRKPGAPIESELSDENEATPQPVQQRKQEQKPPAVYEGPHSPQSQPAQKLGPAPEKPLPGSPKIAAAAAAPAQTPTPVAHQIPQGKPKPAAEPPLTQAITPPTEKSLPKHLEPTVPQPTQRGNAQQKPPVPITPELAQSQLPQAVTPSLQKSPPDNTKVQDPVTQGNQARIELQPQVSAPRQVLAPQQDPSPASQPRTSEVPVAATQVVRAAMPQQKEMGAQFNATVVPLAVAKRVQVLPQKGDDNTQAGPAQVAKAAIKELHPSPRQGISLVKTTVTEPRATSPKRTPPTQPHPPTPTQTSLHSHPYFQLRDYDDLSGPLAPLLALAAASEPEQQLRYHHNTVHPVRPAQNPFSSPGQFAQLPNGPYFAPMATTAGFNTQPMVRPAQLLQQPIGTSSPAASASPDARLLPFNTRPTPPKSNKRPAAMPPVKKAPKKQKPGPPSLPIPPPASESPRRAAYKNLATLVQSCQQARIGTLAAAPVCGRPEFDRIDRLVKDWRVVSRSVPHSGNILEFVNYVDKVMHGNSEIEIFLCRFSKMMLAEAAENNGKPDGRHRTSAEFMDQLLANLGWRETDRPKLYDYVREGKCWKTICNSNDGLLCIMPLDTNFLDIAMFRDEVANFHSQQLGSKFVWGLASVGSQLQISIRYGRELSEFVWESENTVGLTPDELCPLLQPFQIIKMNLVNPRDVDWPRPARWVWDWPMDPTLIPPGDKHCNMCKRKKNCPCFRNNVSEIPRLSIDGSKGSGVRSLGTYKAGQLLGELLGELAPVGTYHNEWTMEFRHPGLDHEPVAEICPRRFGNWVRKVNHSLEPSAEFKVIKISGRWRQMLVALRDIKDGEEITARYGRGYQRKLPYHLVEGFQ
ncbi:hypothetical protein B0H67DRAFT_570957 [Lasiosphaeris hirsuta]|uniref:JmjC domain-containing protein n=1 Tax=Lasiosphaeris hirsuta TaxID=260670 RepID=A0AA40E7S7_9PEZI|nr:hypothetical protein B0H67DRAFT_570957 [Lasiosphaeris hirsuta]